MPDQYPQYFPCRGRPQNKCGDPCVWNKNGKCTTKANRKVEALGLRQAKIAAVARGKIARAGTRPRLPAPPSPPIQTIPPIGGWDMLPDEIRTQILKERTELMRRDRYTPLGAFRPTRAEQRILPLVPQTPDWDDKIVNLGLPRGFFLTIGQVRAIRRGELELTVVPPTYDRSYVLTHDDEIVRGRPRLTHDDEIVWDEDESLFYPIHIYYDPTFGGFRFEEGLRDGVLGRDTDVAGTGGGNPWVVMTPELIEYVISMRRNPAAQYIQAAQRRRKYPECRIQTSGRYVDPRRKAPPVPANKCWPGYELPGRDKQMYVTKADRNGVLTWKRK